MAPSSNDRLKIDLAHWEDSEYAEVTQLVEFQPSKLTVAGSSPVFRSLYVLIAQLAEQRTVNPLVAGSTPAQDAILFRHSSEGKSTIRNRYEVKGSSPFVGAIKYLSGSVAELVIVAPHQGIDRKFFLKF